MGIDDKTMTKIMASAEFHFEPKGRWVFKEGDDGNLFYLLIHGYCQVLKRNAKYLESRRAFREDIKLMNESVFAL
jgi:CRP-like cAMP-binding protein